MSDINLFNPDRERLLDMWDGVASACRNISQWTTDAEIAWLAQAAGWMDGVCGECGSYKGKSALAMVLGGADKVYCSDRFQDGTMKDFQSNLDGRGNVFLFPMESEAASNHIATLQSADDWMFDFFFIDASHAKQDVERDIELWMPLVKPGGILAFHDCHPNEPENGVSQALREKLPHFKVVMDSIAAVRIPTTSI